MTVHTGYKGVLAVNTVRECVDLIRARAAAKPNALRGINATFQFHLRGDGGGSFYIAVAGGAAEIAEGLASGSQVTITVKASDFKEIVLGKLDAEIAYQSGQLWVDGDIWVAQQLQGLIA